MLSFMKSISPELQSDSMAPMAPPQLRRFMVLFHLLTLGMMVFFLGVTVNRPWAQWGWREAALMVLTMSQAGLYIKRMVLMPPHQSPRWWYSYFGAGLFCCLLQTCLVPDFCWFSGIYVVPLCAVFKPRISIPIAAVALASLGVAAVGWQQAFHAAMGALLFRWVILFSLMLMGLFIHQISCTSTERGKLILELEAARRQLLAVREQELELAALRERERLARDLHDCLGHALVTLTVQLEAVQRLYPVHPARAQELLEQMKQLTRASMEDLRRSLAHLRAPGLGERPLTEALTELWAQAPKHNGAAPDCQIAPGADSLPTPVAEALWRVAQEGLTNSRKHAQAKQVRLSLVLEPASVVLRVADDGVGLSPGAENKAGHYGLRGLRERVEGLGGALHLEPGPGRGTTLLARLPLITP